MAKIGRTAAMVAAAIGWVHVSSAGGPAEERVTLSGKRAVFDNRGSEATSGGLELRPTGPWPTPRALTLEAVIVPAKGAGSTLRREIVTRSLDPGQKQFPFGLRLDSSSHLEGWVNNVGTQVTLCRADRPVPAGRSRVAMAYDGDEITLWLGSTEVGRCAAPGSIQSSGGHTVIGAQRHVSTLGNVFKGRIERVAVLPRVVIPVKARSERAGR